ncbi:hypothetical protein L6R50_13685 [Myxococcota bacterium]|nr:hypothetical protein [Myxococcota bacterium]
MTRVTQLSRQHALLAHLRGASGRLFDAQVLAASGQQVGRPSDDPSAAGLLVRLRAEMSSRNAEVERLTLADLQMSATDAALDAATQVLTRIQEIAVQMATETLPPEDLQAAAEEVQALHDELVRIGNTEYGGRYLFAGQTYDQPAFQAEGTYVGSTSGVDLHLGDGGVVEVGTPGDGIFRGAGGGTDLFATAQDLIAALQAGDSDGVQATLDAVQEGLDQVIAARVSLGTRQDFVQSQAARSQDQADLLDADVRALSEADLTAAYTELADAQAAYEAVLQISSQALSVSVFDFLR